MLACAGAAATGGDCGTAALAASSGVVLNSLVNQLEGKGASLLTPTEREARLNLLTSLVTGVTAAVGGDAAVANAVVTIETQNNALLNIYGVKKPDSINLLGHSAVALTGLGMYSFGNDTPLGMSTSEYIGKQSRLRDQVITFIPTTPEQDKQMQNYVAQFVDSKLSGSDFENILINNCADHSIAIMDAAKILTDEQVAFFSTPGTLLTPSTVSLMAKSIPNAVQIKLPQNGVISPALHDLLSTFDKN